MKAVLVFLAIIMMAFAAVTSQEEQHSVLLEHLYEMEDTIGATEDNELDAEEMVETAPLPAATLKAMIVDAQKKIAAAGPGKIPKDLFDRVVAVSKRISDAQVSLNKLTGDHVGGVSNDTWATPGDLIGNHAGMSGANADTLLKIFKHTQNYRKISNDEILDNFDYAETK